jgi:tungstate transport system substrate-binding protein
MRILRLMLLSVFSMTSTLAVAETMRMAVTTSFHNSGLSDSLLPAIERDIGLRVDLLVVGTGQAIRLGESGDVDAILVHSKGAEEAFVIGGYGSHRREIMYNDFVFVGPKGDPANLAAATSAQQALVSIAEAKAIFVSRGDESGTHKKELSLWHTVDVDLSHQSAWYRSVGSGMGAALNTASGMNAYIISDRASWLNFRNKGDLALLYAGDPVLFNQYAYLPVSPERHSHVKDVEAQKLEDWLISSRAKELINSYQIAGVALFTFNAK